MIGVRRYCDRFCLWYCRLGCGGLRGLDMQHYALDSNPITEKNQKNTRDNLDSETSDVQQRLFGLYENETASQQLSGQRLQNRIQCKGISVQDRTKSKLGLVFYWFTHGCFLSYSRLK
jgi:hypothetical protein